MSPQILDSYASRGVPEVTNLENCHMHGSPVPDERKTHVLVKQDVEEFADSKR
jgi:hypothetical protein